MPANTAMVRMLKIIALHPMRVGVERVLFKTRGRAMQLMWTPEKMILYPTMQMMAQRVSMTSPRILRITWLILCPKSTPQRLRKLAGNSWNLFQMTTATVHSLPCWIEQRFVQVASCVLNLSLHAHSPVLLLDLQAPIGHPGRQPMYFFPQHSGNQEGRDPFLTCSIGSNKNPLSPPEIPWLRMIQSNELHLQLGLLCAT